MNMKLSLFVLFALCVLGLIIWGMIAVRGYIARQMASEQTLVRKVNADVPQFIKNELEKVPHDALVGIGFAKMANMSMSMNVATARARTAIARQLNQVVFQMVRNYKVPRGTETDELQLFKERITVAITEVELSGLSIVFRDMDEEITVVKQ
jgi:hypothetical protein